MIQQYVDAAPSVDTDITGCRDSSKNCTDKVAPARTVHVSGPVPGMAVGLAHEIVHVRGNAVPRTYEDYTEEQNAWSSAFGVYRGFSVTDRSTSGYGARYDLWTYDRREQLSCQILEQGCR